QWSPSELSGGRLRVRERSGGASATIDSRMRATDDPATIELRLDDPRGVDELGIVVHGPGDPVDVRRLEGGDLAERVIVELAERDDGRPGIVQRRPRPAAQVPRPMADQR